MKKIFSLLALETLFVSLILATTSMSSAQSLDFNQLTVKGLYQQTTNSPCVYGQTCQDPNPWPALVTIPTDDSVVLLRSSDFTVGQLTTALNSNTFLIGIDALDNARVQQLTYFAMYIGDNVNPIDEYTKGSVDIISVNKGSGFADATLTGFTSLAGYAQDTKVYFKVSMTNVNDGWEQFFLFPTSGPNAVPEPATMLLFGAGLAGLAGFARRKRS